MTDRVALVPKPDAEEAIGALRAAGAYDDGRRVREHGPDAVAIPVTRPVDLDPVAAVVPDADPERRRRGLPDLLRERGFDDDAVERAPSSWAVVGDVVLVDFGACERRATVGEALLDLHGEADTVLARHGVAGEHREPDVEVVAGTGETETVHVEHGTEYALDLSAVMFSPGNKAERARIGSLVDPGEHVFDMFAGIGYFTLPAARAGARVTAVERNPTAFRYLVENARRNDVADRVRPVLADCRDAAARRDLAAERVVMGHYDARRALDAALAALGPRGTVHLHDATGDGDRYVRPLDRLRAAAAERGYRLSATETRTVKSHAPGVWHVVVDAHLER